MWNSFHGLKSMFSAKQNETLPRCPSVELSKISGFALQTFLKNKYTALPIEIDSPNPGPIEPLPPVMFNSLAWFPDIRKSGDWL